MELNKSIIITDANQVRSPVSSYKRYFHLPLSSFNPGASGATWIPSDGNTLGGWRLDAVGEILEFGSDMHADWDGATDIVVELYFEVNVDNTGGGAGDTVDLKLISYYKGIGEVATKTQTVEVATVVGQSAQYKTFKVTFTIDWDLADNVVQVGDKIGFVLNLETDTSEVDNIIITQGSASFHYDTTHIGTESGDV